MGNVESLPIKHARQDIGHVTIALKYPNKVRIIYETEQTKSALNEIMR